jgi:rhodanese-related sulfurtransferase
MARVFAANLLLLPFFEMVATGAHVCTGWIYRWRLVEFSVGIDVRWLDWLPFGSVRGIAPHDLQRCILRGDPLALIDVRTSWEFRQGHIANSRSVPLHALKGKLPYLSLDPEVAVVAICKTAHRSVPAVRILQSKGYSSVQLAGGMDRWRRNGLPFVSGGEG